MAFDPSGLPALRDVIREHNLRAEKSLGQNFLFDQNLTDKIARSAGDLSAHTIFEIGPGPGGLTRSILKTHDASVIAIEYDPRAVTALENLKSHASGQLSVMYADGLKTDLTDLAPAPRAIIANLPYNIATPLLIGWLQQIRKDMHAFSSMTLMFQKEVAERIIAAPGTKAYGRLSVISQWLCDAHKVFDVPASAFVPPPKVTSSIVHLKPRQLHAGAPAFHEVEAVTAAAFGQRRKMIRSSLKNDLPKIHAAGIDDTLRAEDLSIEDYLLICRK